MLNSWLQNSSSQTNGWCRPLVFLWLERMWCNTTCHFSTLSRIESRRSVFFVQIFLFSFMFFHNMKYIKKKHIRIQSQDTWLKTQDNEREKRQNKSESELANTIQMSSCGNLFSSIVLILFCSFNGGRKHACKYRFQWFSLDSRLIL